MGVRSINKTTVPTARGMICEQLIPLTWLKLVIDIITIRNQYHSRIWVKFYDYYLFHITHPQNNCDAGRMKTALLRWKIEEWHVERNKCEIRDEG